MGFSSSRLYHHRLYTFVVLSFLTLSLVFLIVAASLHNLYSFDASEFGIPEDVLTGSSHFGAFIACADMDGVEGEQPFSIHQCTPVSSNCHVAYTYTTPDGEGEVDTDMGPYW